MIKRVSVCWLPEGADPDRFWEYHTKVHAVDAARVAGPRLKKYVINRITRVVSGTPTFFDLIETWWDDEQEMHQAFDVELHAAKAASGKTIMEDFWSRVAGGFTTVVEEFVAKDSTAEIRGNSEKRG